MNIKNKIITVEDLGILSFASALEVQEDYFYKIISEKKANRQKAQPTPTDNFLLFVEHKPVYTLGKSGDIQHLLLDQNGLKEKEIEFYKTNRGGDITFHGLGQIVGYPILDLDNFFTDIHKYLRFLEEIIIKTLAEYGLTATRSKGETGVWLDAETPFARKICALGVRASRWVTMHGFALNVNTDLTYFEHIVPCGIKGKGVTSLKAELGKEISVNQVKEKLVKHFLDLFEAELK
ncbi:lipoyl(octanoyl) transferase LipB [Flavobacteriaceae bacterium]|nr:lipoyl(octanoyl) transferase LipB [Flavobacteriaceae bacterium]